MLYSYFLYFLGLYTWSYKPRDKLEKLLLKRYLDFKLSAPIKNNKKLITINDSNSNSPEQSITTNTSILQTSYINLSILRGLRISTKRKIILYNLYSLCIFIILCIEPMYLFYNMCINKNDNFVEYMLLFLMNINTPINYIWAKYYFSSNHFDLFINTCRRNSNENNENSNESDCNNYSAMCSSYISTIIILTGISIVISLIRPNTFYNEYYYISFFNRPIGISLIILEWIYCRLTYCFILSTFTIVFCKHIQDIKKLIRDIKTNEIDLEDSYCLTKLIKEITHLRNTIEISIKFYNTLLSFITITGGISIAIFSRQQYVKFDRMREFNFEDHEYYIVQGYMLYVICQSIFFYTVIRYSTIRTQLSKLIQGSSFVNRFLTRWSTSKMKRKCKDSNEIKQYNKMILVIEQENATSIDWMILEKLCSYTWMDFSILGISTQDGTLIKKVVAFSSIIYIILSYT